MIDGLLFILFVVPPQLLDYREHPLPGSRGKLNYPVAGNYPACFSNVFFDVFSDGCVLIPTAEERFSQALTICAGLELIPLPSPLPFV